MNGSTIETDGEENSPLNQEINIDELSDENLKTLRQSTKSILKKPGEEDLDDFEAWMKSRALIKPDDQLDLNDIELAEEIPRTLSQTNTNVIKNLAVYSYAAKEYILLPEEGNTVTLYNLPSTSLHLDSAEAKKQIEEYGEDAFLMPEKSRQKSIAKSILAPKDTEAAEADDEDKEAKEEQKPEGDEEEGENEEEEEEEGEGEEDAGAAEAAAAASQAEESAAGGAGGGRKKKLINQFNYCERGALTYSNPTRAIEAQTIPPPRSTFGGTVLQWVIFDSYNEDFEKQQKDKEKDKKGSTAPKRDDQKKKIDKTQQAEELNKKYLKCWQILERMINQNIYDEIAQDYRTYEDPSDEYRDGEGTLLPLWKFCYEKTKKMNVTDMFFNPHYYDLYAVCFGSHDFLKQNPEGALCLFTIKNPSYPDYIIMCESGVMSCDIHPTYPFLVVIGMYDGNVGVYNLQQGIAPIYTSQGVNGKHAGSVNEVKWGLDMPDGEINFYTVSSDGMVFNWVLMQNRLFITRIITLYLDVPSVEGPDGVQIKLKSCGTALTFHPKDKEIFLVGTEEGLIYKCSISYSSKYLMTYHAHHLSVYRIDFNKYNSNIFASCSGDWRVKIWEDMRPDPLFVFDLGTSVGDVKWAPYSSTVFAAVTLAGKVFVFDLNVNKYKAICIQSIVPQRKNKLTRLIFNEKLPFIIVGDDKGTTISLKLSPNLRIMCKPPKKQPWLDQSTMQIQKLDKLLSLVREMPEGAKEEEDDVSEKS
ncbi:dynein intermediate chain 2, ciliary [Condylostylus longicornis]|uniref:dynein intermediate chain 2, ciliary n=1 Tax=Condylostylus longicornis TaxID=2530218 RepID=UPI00244DDD81|nr:dynein intermediate chain 2, ciliary [Condylostylus longicornis]